MVNHTAEMGFTPACQTANHPKWMKDSSGHWHLFVSRGACYRHYVIKGCRDGYTIALHRPYQSTQRVFWPDTLEQARTACEGHLVSGKWEVDK